MSVVLLLLLFLFLATAALWWRERQRANTLLRQQQTMREELSRSFEAQRVLERTRAAAEERERIHADLHDDIGARLLSLVYSARETAQADLMRTILQDLRDVVSRSRGAPGTLLDVLSEIRSESGQRLEALGGQLDWQQADDLPDPALDHGHALHLFRIVREAISNALRHGQARHIRIRVRVSGPTLMLDLTDDGPGLGDQAPEGRGTDNMRSRAAELHGTIAWDAGTLGGTKVLLQFPLPPDTASR
ncbi:MAG TPA: ATP-binding protein [Solimonas sp.]